jgi:hypothetical protein
LQRGFATGEIAATVKAWENTSAWQVINLPIQQLAKLRYSFKREIDTHREPFYFLRAKTVRFAPNASSGIFIAAGRRS